MSGERKVSFQAEVLTERRVSLKPEPRDPVQEVKPERRESVQEVKPERRDSVQATMMSYLGLLRPEVLVARIARLSLSTS